MSDIGLKFPLWAYFFIPPVILSDWLGWLAAPLALAAAAAWLGLWRGRRDTALLALVVVAALVVTWAVVPVSGGRLVVAACANFIWFMAIVLPLRWIAGRVMRAPRRDRP